MVSNKTGSKAPLTGSNPALGSQAGEKSDARRTHMPSADFPNRYSIRETGTERVLSCIEAPNLSVQVKLGLSVSASAVNKSEQGTIFLDGVAQSGPLLDHSRQVYNFDHHEGCVRVFTISTCEQVLIMLKKGLDLRNREWKIFANDPDLDTILAIWLLLNHIRISEQESVRGHILFPLIRLEGIIDSLGLEMKQLSGLPPAIINQSQRIIDYLRRKEVKIKKDGQWEKTDFLTYTAGVLYEIDQIIYEPQKFGQLLGIEELARVDLPDNRVAVVLQSDMGIYEIEPLLKKLYGGSVGLAILRKTPTVYTLRQMDPFMRGSLEDVYERLNFMDPAVKCRSGDKWGGSLDIGGSPRKHGTQLSPEEIVKGCRDGLQKSTFIQKSLRFFLVAVLSLAALTAAQYSIAYKIPTHWFDLPFVGAMLSVSYFRFSLVLIFLTTLILAGASNRRLWQFGIISPEGKTWWLILPFTLLTAYMGGAWMPMKPAALTKLGNIKFLLACILLPFAAEYLFRGVIHGILAQKSRIQSCSSKYFISWPNFGTSLLYALFLVHLPLLHNTPFNPLLISLHQGSIFAAAFFFSISLGFVRERSHSFLTTFLFHLISIIVIIFLPDALVFLNHIWNFSIPTIPF